LHTGKTRNRALRTAWLIALAAALLAACAGGGGSGGGSSGGGTSGGGSSGGGSSGGSSSGGQAETVKLTFGLWGAADQVAATQKLIDIFMEKHPNIKVETVYKDWGNYWTWITAQASSKDLPDVYKMSFAYVDNYARLGAMRPLDDLIAASGFDLSDFEPATLDYHKFDGKQVSLPRDSNTVVMYYNKDLFYAAGIPYPEKEMTWEELLPILKKLTLDENGNSADSPSFNPEKIVQWGIMANPSGLGDSLLEPQLQSNGATLSDENGKITLDTPEAREVLQFFKDLIVTHHVSTSSGTIAALGGIDILAFSSGKVAMSFGGSWNATDYNAAKINFGTMLPPKFKEVKSVAQPAGYAMSPYTKHEQEAWTLLSWLIGPEGQSEMAKMNDGIPASKIAQQVYLKDGDPNKQIFIEAARYQISAPWYDGKTRLIWEILPQKMPGLVEGTSDFDQTIREIA